MKADLFISELTFTETALWLRLKKENVKALLLLMSSVYLYPVLMDGF